MDFEADVCLAGGHVAEEEVGHKGTVPPRRVLLVLPSLRRIILVLILDRAQSMALFKASPSSSGSRAATSW